MKSILLGFALIAIGLFVLIPVAVNFPDSWIGGILAMALITLGVVAICRGAASRRKERLQ